MKFIRVSSSQLVNKTPIIGFHRIAQSLWSYNGSVDMNTTGMPYYDEMLQNPEQFLSEGIEARVVLMDPQEYDQAIAEGFWSQKSFKKEYKAFDIFRDEVMDKRTDPNKVRWLAESPDKLPMPVLHYKGDGTFFQEGDHRNKAVQLKGEDEIPVLVVNQKYRSRLDLSGYESEDQVSDELYELMREEGPEDLIKALELSDSDWPDYINNDFDDYLYEKFKDADSFRMDSRFGGKVIAALKKDGFYEEGKTLLEMCDGDQDIVLDILSPIIRFYAEHPQLYFSDYKLINSYGLTHEGKKLALEYLDTKSYYNSLVYNKSIDRLIEMKEKIEAYQNRYFR